jgi:tetratricopeptide (TPR) repeat protein
VVAVLAAAVLACPTRARLHPLTVDYNVQCVRLMNEGRLDDAEIACDHALEFTPDYAEVWCNKGLIEMFRGKLDAAKEHFIKAIRLNNELAQAYSSFGVLELRQRHPDQARLLFERALKVNPDYLEARYNLAIAWVELGRRDEARREYKTLLLVNPNLADPHQDLGVLALEDHQVAEAITHLEAAVQLNPRHPTAWLNLGAAYVEAARYQDAQNAFRACLDADPQSLPCRRAIELVTRAAAVQTPVLQEAMQAEGLYARGLRQLEKGAREAAERSFRACAGSDLACRYALHQLQEADGKTSEAAATCAEFLRAAAADLYPQETAHCEQEVSRSGSMAPPRQPR